MELGTESESQSADLEERISTAINDFGCVFTTLTGEKMGSTSTAHSMLIVSSTSLSHSLPLYLSLSRCVRLFIHESCSASASNSIVERVRLWRYDWPQIQCMIGLGLKRSSDRIDRR